MSPLVCPTCGRDLDLADGSAACRTCRPNAVTTPPPGASLGALLGRWEDEFARGRDLPAAELCSDCPERAVELERLIEALRGMKALLNTGRPDAHTSGHGAGLSVPDGSFVTLPPGTPFAAAPPVAAKVPGYEILDELGRGAMGVVYRAWQVTLNRAVALKMILSGGHASGDELARFRREAESLGELTHSNILQVYEVGEQDGLPYFSMEFCPGGSLDRRLAAKPLPGREAAGLVLTLARAVQAAHERGIVHRDLKPANVLLAADGTPKVSDFGLAKRLGQQGRTASGAVMGTPSYMAPEQASGKGKEIGPAADVYALGAILYECLTGRPPFLAATPLETILQVIVEDPAPPRSVQPAAPRDLETICLKCLQKEPPRRYASAAALADDLRRYLDGEPILARPMGPVGRLMKWARRRPAVAVLLAAVLLALAGGVVVSSYFAVEARDQAEQARGLARSATDAREEADDAREEAITALVDGLLRPIGREEERIGPVEAAALSRLASLANERLRRHFLKTALSRPEGARRLSFRADMAAHAVVGLNPDQRARTLALVRGRLAEPGAEPRVRKACVYLGVALGDSDETFLAQAARVLGEAAGTNVEELDALAGAFARLAPHLGRNGVAESAAALTRGLHKLAAEVPDLASFIKVAAAFERVALRLAPREAQTCAAALARKLLERLSRDGGLAWETGDDEETVPTTQTRPAEAVKKLAPFLSPKAVAETARGILKLAGDANTSRHQALADMIGPLAPQLAAEDAGATLQALLMQAIGERDMDGEASETFSLYALRHLAKRLGPEQAAAAAKATLELSAQSKHWGIQAVVLAHLAPQLAAKEAGATVRALIRLVATRVNQANEPGTEKNAIWEALVNLVSKLAPNEAGVTARAVLELAADPKILLRTSSLQQVERTLSFLAPQLDAEGAAASAGMIVKLAAKATTPDSLASLAGAFARLGPRLDKKKASAGAATLVGAILQRVAAGTFPFASFNATEERLFTRLVNQLDPEGAAAAARLALELALKASQPAHLADLMNAFGQLAPRLTDKEACAGVAGFTQKILLREGKTNYFQEYRVLGALERLASRLEPKEAGAVARALLQQADKGATPDSVVMLAGLFGRLAPRLDAKEARAGAARLARKVLNPEPKGTDGNALVALAQTFLRLAPWLGPDDLQAGTAALTCGILELSGGNEPVAVHVEPGGLISFDMILGKDVEGTVRVETPSALALAFKQLAPYVDTQTASSAARAVLHRMARTRDAPPLTALVRAFESLSPRLEPAAAAAVGRRALDLVAKAPTTQSFMALARAFEGLASRLEPQQAREGLAALAHQTLDWMTPPAERSRLSELANLFARLTGRLDEKAISALAHTVRKLAARTNNVHSLATLARAFEKLAPRLKTREASELAAMLAERILQRIAKESEAIALATLRAAFEKLAPRLDKQARVVSAQLTLELLIKSDQLAEPTLVRALQRLTPRLDAKNALAVARAMITPAMHDLSTDALKSLAGAFQDLVDKLSDHELIDLLKRPACIGAFRETVLLELGRRTKRKFADLWEFVTWAREHRPDLDLLTPPQPPEN
jgi:hypothetical protein